MAVKLFVGGLAGITSSDRLRDTFTAVGTVASASIVKDPAGQSRGCGFVELDMGQQATDAIARPHGSVLDGRSLRVALSAKPSSNGGARR